MALPLSPLHRRRAITTATVQIDIQQTIGLDSYRPTASYPAPGFATARGGSGNRSSAHAVQGILKDTTPAIWFAGPRLAENLAAALVLRARDERLPLPAAVLLQTRRWI